MHAHQGMALALGTLCITSARTWPPNADQVICLWIPHESKTEDPQGLPRHAIATAKRALHDHFTSSL